MSVFLRHFVFLQRVYVGLTLFLGLVDLQERRGDTRIKKSLPGEEEGRKGRDSYSSRA